MTRKLIITLTLILIYGCKDDINDSDKRNENWVFWVDKKTGKASWVPVTGNETTLKDGRYTSFYSKGAIYSKVKLRNGKQIDTIYFYSLKEELLRYKLVKNDSFYYVKDGPYTSYFQKGKIFEKGIIENHDIGDEWTKYFENGKIEWTKKLKDGTGFLRWYYDNGQISIINYKVKGKVNGQVKGWFEDGKIKLISNWKDDLQNGDCETFYENGKLKEKENWVNDKLDGKRETWYENGQKEQIEFYNNDVRDGQLIQWYSNGNKKAVVNFASGQVSGKVSIYFENGNPKVVGSYKDGKREGVFFYYDEKGKPIRKQTYSKGELIADKQ